MPVDLEKLVSFAHRMVNDLELESEDGETTVWFCEAELLISSGMNLQSMDVSLCRYFEKELGPLTDKERKAAIAEFHRQMLEALGLPVLERNLDPDPLELPVIHEPATFRSNGKHGSELHKFTEQEVDKLLALIERERPELLAHYRADLERWVAEGRPKNDHRGRSQFAGSAMGSFILHDNPDLDSREASRAVSEIIVRINPPYL